MADTEKKIAGIGLDFLSLLPDDLLYSILLPLPIDALVNLASTAPKWREFLCCPEFARLHLLRWRSNYGIISKGNHNLVYWTMLDVGSALNAAVTGVIDEAGAFPDVIWHQLKAAFDQIAGKCPGLLVSDSCDGQILIMVDYYRRPKLLVCNPMLMSCRTFYPPINSSPTFLKWNLVFVQSTKRYKIIGMSTDKLISEPPVGWGRTFHILDIRTGDAADAWTEVRVGWGEVVGKSIWHGRRLLKSVTVEEKDGVTKLYYLGWTLRSTDSLVWSTLIGIDVDTYDVTAVDVPAFPGMQGLMGAVWAGASALGKFYVTDAWNATDQVFNVFVIDDFHNPIWRLMRMDAREYGHYGNFIQPFACMDDDKFFYEIREAGFPPDEIVHADPDDGSLKDFEVPYNHRYFDVRHVHSFIRI